MADSDQVVRTDATSLIGELGKAFLELNAHKDAAEDKVEWEEIEKHFCYLETMMKKKFEELEVKEREIQDRESETRTMIADREWVVAAKEQDLSDWIQELKDASVGEIKEARAIHVPASLELIDCGDSKESKVSTSPGDANAHLADLEENSPHRTGENVEVVAGEVKPRPELTQFCEQMDAKGLLNFTMENQKNRSANCAELSVALESATEPGRLVLASLEGFYPPDDSTQEGGNRDAAFQGMRQSCLLLLEAMATILARADPGADHHLNPEIKQQAKAIADEWKPKLAGEVIDAANGNSLEARAFLQLLATFSIASEFDEEELCKLVLAVAHQRRAPELCHSLGIAHKIPGIVEELIKNGKQFDAVHFVHSFQLTERFPLVPLLKTYLKDLRRNAQGKGSRLGTSQNDINAEELAAVKAVIWCIEEYKLEEDYPLDPLQRRMAQLEKSKPDTKKRSGDFGKKQQFKKPRANGVYGFRAPAIANAARQAPPVYGERAIYAGTSERYPYAGGSEAAYPQQAYDQRSYYYPQDERVPATTYSPAPFNYGSSIGNATQPSHQPYM